jgi:dienelactone hydrolase
VSAVVLVLAGGRARSTAPASRRHLSYQRMNPFARVVHRATRDHGVAVWQLCYRVRGWNGADQDPVQDARWALDRIRRKHPDAPVVLIGHSMGGRTALYVGGDDPVVGVCALAPWVEPGDPFSQLAGRLVVIAHGNRDRMTRPSASRRYAADAAAAGARVAHFDVDGDAHAMLRRATDWHALARDTVLYALGIAQQGQLARVLAAPAAERVDVPLAEADR